MEVNFRRYLQFFLSIGLWRKWSNFPLGSEFGVFFHSGVSLVCIDSCWKRQQNSSRAERQVVSLRRGANHPRLRILQLERPRVPFVVHDRFSAFARVANTFACV